MVHPLTEVAQWCHEVAQVSLKSLILALIFRNCKVYSTQRARGDEKCWCHSEIDPRFFFIPLFYPGIKFPKDILSPGIFFPSDP